MSLTKAKTHIVDLNKDTIINGVRVGKGNNSINDNTAIGANAVASISNGSANTAVGAAAMNQTTSGAYNSVLGASALQFNVLGSSNTAVGALVLTMNTASNNTAVGAAAMNQNTTGAENVAVGSEAFTSNLNGAQNTAVGFSALLDQVSANFNTAVGRNALKAVTSSQNTAIGRGALESATTGASNTACGMGALSTLINFSNCAGLGWGAEVSGDNQVRLGNAATTAVTSQVGSWSDERDKADIRDTVLGLEFIKSLRPVDFKWDYREDYRIEAPEYVLKPLHLKDDATDEEKAEYELQLQAHNAYKIEHNLWLENSKLANLVHDGTHKRTRFHHGLIAQEVAALIQQTGLDFGGFQDHTIKGGDEAMTISYMELISPLIKAVQELSDKVTKLESV
jgi:hypothetical protein